AVLVYLVRQRLTRGYAESHVGEELRNARKEADAGDVVPLGFYHQRFDQFAACSQTLGCGRHRDRANLSQVHAIEVECAAADDLTIVLCDYEVAYVFTQLSD